LPEVALLHQRAQGLKRLLAEHLSRLNLSALPGRASAHQQGPTRPAQPQRLSSAGRIAVHPPLLPESLDIPTQSGLFELQSLDQLSRPGLPQKVNRYQDIELPNA